MKKAIKKKIKKVLPKKVTVEVEGPPLKVRGKAEWMPGHVREAERRS